MSLVGYGVPDLKIKLVAHISLILIVLLLGRSKDLHAAELPEFYRGIRAMGMGNAFTAISDDADAAFYNPAGLALNRNYEFRLLNPKISVSSDDITTASEIKNATANLNGGAIAKLFGKHVYGEASIFPAFYFPDFILGYYY